MSQADDNREFISGARARGEPNFVAGRPAMLPRLLLAAGLTIGVMLPLIWVAFDVVEPASETIHSDAAAAAAPEVPTSDSVLPATSSKQPIETTIGAASDGQESASASPAVTSPPVDLSSERPSPPSLAKPTVPQASDKEAVPAPVASEETKPRSAEASDKAAVPEPVISEEAKARPAEVKEAAPAPAASEEAKPRSAEATDKEAVPAPVASEETRPRSAEASDKEAVPPPAASEEAKLRSAEALAPTASVMPPMEKTAEPKSGWPSTSSTSSIQTSAETAPAGRPLAPASPSVDLEPSPARPSPPQASDKEAVPAPGGSEEAKPRSAEAATPGVSASRQVETPRKARPQRSARTSRNDRTRASANEVRSRKTVYRARPRDRADWIAVLRDTGWLGSGRRH